MVTVGGIVDGGFRLVRARPVSVLVWGALYFVASLCGTLLLIRPIAQAQLGGQVDVAASMTMLGSIYLFDFGLLILMTILSAAALRATLRPEQSGFAFLRLGMDELRLLALVLLLMAIYFLIFMIATIVGGILGAIAAAGNPASMVMVIGSLLLASLLLIVFLQVRLSPVLALTMTRRRIVIGDAWRLTRGHFWTLLGGYAVIGLMLIIGYVVVFALTMRPYYAELAQGGFRPEALSAAARHQSERMVAGPDPMMVLGWIVSAILGGGAIAVWNGAVAAATGALLGEKDEDVGAVFA